MHSLADELGMSKASESVDFPGAEITLVAGLDRNHKIDKEPRGRLHWEPELSGQVSAQAGPALSTDARLRYVLPIEIGRGGLGAIYKVFDTDLQRRLAMMARQRVSSRKPIPIACEAFGQEPRAPLRAPSRPMTSAARDSATRVRAPRSTTCSPGDP